MYLVDGYEWRLSENGRQMHEGLQKGSCHFAISSADSPRYNRAYLQIAHLPREQQHLHRRSHVNVRHRAKLLVGPYDRRAVEDHVRVEQLRSVLRRQAQIHRV